MAARRAIDDALDLARMPALTFIARNQPLPRDMLQVIRIAARCPDASKAAVESTHAPLRVIHAAAVFYLEEMLFFPDAEGRRILGVSADAPRAELRLHMGWLLRWLHPDRNSSEKTALLSARVIEAWRELGHDHRRGVPTQNLAVEQLGSRRPEPRRRGRVPSMRVRWIAVPILSMPPPRAYRQRAVILALAIALVLALVFLLRTDPLAFDRQADFTTWLQGLFSIPNRRRLELRFIPGPESDLLRSAVVCRTL